MVGTSFNPIKLSSLLWAIITAISRIYHSLTHFSMELTSVLMPNNIPFWSFLHQSPPPPPNCEFILPPPKHTSNEVEDPTQNGNSQCVWRVVLLPLILKSFCLPFTLELLLQFLSRDSHASSPYLLDRARFTPDQLTDWLSRGQKQRHLMNAVHVKPTRSPRIVLAPLSHHVGISLLSCL